MEDIIVLCVMVVLTVIVCGILIPNSIVVTKKSKAPDLKITIRAIIRWEQLNEKPFYSMEYGDESDVISLFYVCSPDNENTLLSDFKKELTDESLKQMIKEFEDQISIAAQFQQAKKGEAEESNESGSVWIRDIVTLLVMKGLDVHFALNEMELYEIPLFLKAHERIIREQKEDSRLWTYIIASPNLKRSISSPEKLCPFPCDVEKKKELSDEELKRGLSIFEAFMNSSN